MPEVRLAEVLALKAGEHLHLDSVVDHPPAAGSPAWLPLVEDVAVRLRNHAGAWAVTLSLGTSSTLPTRAERSALISHCRADPSSEPPYVARLRKRWLLNTWEGEVHNWKRQVSTGIVETITFSRSLLEATEDLPFFGSLMLEVSGSAGRRS